MPTTHEFETLLYKTEPPVATITLNRPEHLNTIVPPMPDEIETAIGLAERDNNIKVIVLRGAGRAFSGGYDFGGGFKHWGDAMNTDGRWDPGKDFAMVGARETGPTQKFMAIWRASKPVIAQVHGWCVGGASDYALCADIVIASDDAVIGTPYARMWGAYLTGMWLYRLSLAKVKWHSLTGEPLTGIQAAAVELINESVPFDKLEARIAEVAAKLATIPLSQLQAQKLNNAAVVAAGALKPTSVYTVTRIENALVVIAHLSEGIPRHWLIDNTSLETFLDGELRYGLQAAVEAKVLADVNGTSGTQVVAYATSVLTTLRKGIAKLETAGYTASAFVLHPTDWEGVELALSAQSAVEHMGLPYDPATRRLFGVPVVTTNAQVAGVGHVVATDSVALDTDTRGVDVQWSENATADSLGRTSCSPVRVTLCDTRNGSRHQPSLTLQAITQSQSGRIIVTLSVFAAACARS